MREVKLQELKAKSEAPDLRGRDVNIVRAGEVVRFRRS
jgi:hypothetical protein